MALRNGAQDMQWGINSFNQGMQRRRAEEIAADERDAAAGEQAQQQGVSIFEQARKAAADREDLQAQLAARAQEGVDERAFRKGEDALTRAQQLAIEKERAEREEALASAKEIAEQGRFRTREESETARHKETIRLQRAEEEGRNKRRGMDVQDHQQRITAELEEKRRQADIKKDTDDDKNATANRKIDNPGGESLSSMERTLQQMYSAMANADRATRKKIEADADHLRERIRLAEGRAAGGGTGGGGGAGSDTGDYWQR